MLVKSGADVHAEDNRHCSCLLAAVRRGHVDVVSWLCGDYRLSKPLDVLSRAPPQHEKDGKTNASTASSSSSGASGAAASGSGGGGGGGGKKGRVARKPANGWSGVVRQFPNDAELERVRSQVPLEQSAAVPSPGAPKTIAAAKAAVANSAAGAANKAAAAPTANAKKPVALAQPGVAPQPVAPVAAGAAAAGAQHISRAPDGAKYSTPNPGKQTAALQNSSQSANFNAKGLLILVKYDNSILNWFLEMRRLTDMR